MNYELWGTPLKTTNQFDATPRIQTLWTLLCSHTAIQFISFSSIWWALSFKINRLWETLSNAFAKSKKLTSTLSPSSIHPVTLSRNSSKLLRHDLPFLKPCWELGINVAFVNKSWRVANRVLYSYVVLLISALHKNEDDYTYRCAWYYMIEVVSTNFASV